MAKEFLKGLSQAAYVEYGYAQVEPNHLSAQRTGQIFAQLPAASDIEVLENGEKIKKFADTSLEKGIMKVPFITVNSWNEWTETSYLEPDDLYGYGYLEAIKDVFGEK